MLASSQTSGSTASREERFRNAGVHTDEFATVVANIAQNSGDPRICIAVLDGPIDRAHPCFAGAELEIVPTWIDTTDINGAAASHGTHVASLIFGQPHSPVRGIAPRCRGLIIPIFGDRPDGGFATCLQLDLARAVLMAVERGAHVINISGGQPAASSEPEPLLAQAIKTCADRNILIVSATGNDGCECLHIPAAAASVLSVGAADLDGNPIASSNWGGVYQVQGVIAPGQDVLGAAPGGGVSRKTGTSFAAAVVSGVAGLLLSIQVSDGRMPDPHGVRAALLQSTLQCVPEADRDYRRCLAGRLDVTEAITFIRGETKMTDTGVVLMSAALGLAAEPHREQPSPALTAVHAATSAAIHPAEATGLIATLPESAGIAPSCGGEGKCSCQSKGSCGCGGGQKPAMVYALGTLGYDFGSEARRVLIYSSDVHGSQ